MQSSCDDNRAVLSANIAVIIADGVGRSAVFREYKRYIISLPCGTPELIGKIKVLASSI